MTGRLDTAAWTALRIVAGGMFLCHGVQKLFGVLGGHLQPVGSQLWIGGIIELVGGTLIALGLLTRPAAFIAAGMTAVAYFQFHWKLEVADLKFLPIVNGGELAVVYCFLFLLFAIRGAGPISVDRRLGRA